MQTSGRGVFQAFQNQQKANMIEVEKWKNVGVRAEKQVGHFEEQCFSNFNLNVNHLHVTLN